MFSENQVRDIVIFDAEATESTAQTFLSSASAKEARVLTAAGDAVPTAVGDFKVLVKRPDGKLKTTEVIKPSKVSGFTKIAPATANEKKYEIAIPAGVTTGDILQVKIVFNQWGSKSFEDQYFKYGVYKVVAGDTNDTIINGLIQSLSKNFSREEPKTGTSTTLATYAVQATYADEAAAFADIAALDNGQVVAVTANAKYYTVTDDTGGNFAAAFTELAAIGSYTIQDNPLFTFAKTGNGTTVQLSIESKEQEYVTGKKQGHPLVFRVTNDFDGVQTVTERVINPGSGRRIRDLEWFCLGGTGDIYRGMGYPHNFEAPEYASSLTGSYYVLNLEYYDGDGISHAVQKSPRVLHIASTDKAEINKLITDIEAATGLTLADFA